MPAGRGARPRRLEGALAAMSLNPWWTRWSDFATMGGYGLYVWGSFGAGVLVVAAELAALLVRRAGLRQGAGSDDDAAPDNPESTT